MKKQIELKVKAERKLYYDQNSSYGIYAMTPITNGEQVDLNDYGNFVVTGNTPELTIDGEYEIIIEPTTSKKWGDGYSFVKVKQKRPETPKEQQAYIRSMVRPDLAEQLIAKYPNENILDLMKVDKIDYSDIYGMGRHTYEKIKNFLFKNLEIQEAIVELQDLNISFVAMKKLIDHFGSPEIVVSKVKSNIYSLCEVKTFGFKKVDEYALNRGDDKENKNRVYAGIVYLLEEEETQGHCWLSEDALIDKAYDLLQVDKKVIREVLHKNTEKKTQIVKIEDRIALQRVYYYETYIKSKLLKLLKAQSTMKFSNDIDKQIKKIESEQGFPFSEEQREAILLAMEHNVFILNGKGGVGKSTVLRGIIACMSNYNHVACALSGKASNIMKSLGLNAMTIHRLLGVDPSTKGFIHNSQNKLPYPIIIVDEASMCSGYLFYSLICAIKNGSKLIIVGDSGQLPAISAGAVFDDILRAKTLPMKELTQVHRQAAKSGILSEANKIREGQQIIGRYDSGRKTFGELNDFVVFPMENREAIKDLTLNVCESYLGNGKDPKDFQVICGLKAKGEIAVRNLNKELQAIFNDTSKEFIKKGGYEYREGDRIIQSGNNYEAGENGDLQVFNGTIGYITKIEIDKADEKKTKVWIQFEGIEETVPYTVSELDMIELAYAITVHRSQGSTIPHVLFVFDIASYTLLSRQFVYTGITRSSKACVMICENKALYKAINTDSGGTRRTFLYDLLVKERE